MVSSWQSFMEDRFSTEGVMEKRYRVTLIEEERRELRAMVTAGKAAARKWGRATVERIRKQFVEEGLEETLQPKPSLRVYERRLDGKAEAHLVAIACGAPPEGRSRWTLRLLGDRLVALGHVESIAHETVRRT